MIPTYPEFFNRAPRIRTFDPLAAFLGAPVDGVFEYGFADAVKLAGHSCPTVAGTYLMVRAGLAALYPNDLPERGGVRVAFDEAATQGVTGVMAAVASLITGARERDGFHGLAGRFNRNGLLTFAKPVGAGMMLERVDTGAKVGVDYRPGCVPGNPAMGPLMQACLDGSADPAERIEFGRLWQERVERILIDHAEDRGMILVRDM